MKHKAMRLLSCTLAVLMVVLLAASVLAPTAYAANDRDYRTQRKYKTTVRLSGREAEGRYELTTKDLYLFSLEGTAPGDTWYGSVRVTNETEADMAISVQSITSNLKQDTLLFDMLDLRISVAGKTVYRGAYAAEGASVTDYYLLAPGDVMFFDIRVKLPGGADNSYQGRQMDSTWTFDAVFIEPEAEILDYTVCYVDQYFMPLLPDKLGHGYPNEIITEYAADINGFTPDAQIKQLLLAEEGDNIIYFIYYPEETTLTPEDPPAEPPIDPPDTSMPIDPEDVINTGVDLSLSNTSFTPYLCILLLSLITIVLTYFRIRSTKHAQATPSTHTTSEKEDA